MHELPVTRARRIALAAQGFDRARPRRPTAKDVLGIVRRLGLVQLDFVNVLVPAQYMVLFARLGPYARTLLDDLVRARALTEQWAHEASILPVETWPLLRHRMEVRGTRAYFASFVKKHPDYAAWVLDHVRANGPLVAADVPDREGVVRRIPNSWVGTIPRAALETHFGQGRLAVVERRPNYARVYDLAERVIPREHHERAVSHEDAQRELLILAARAYGVATAADLADYYRMPTPVARVRLRELVESGALVQARVEGWRELAYLHPDAASRAPPEIHASALLSPFDPVVWFRPRASRLFDFDYRIEIYVPAAQRRWGYYVLPFLLGERVVARVDLKADRGAKKLLVLAAHLEEHARADRVAASLAKELVTLARWLDLDAVVVRARTAFARALSSAVAALNARRA